MALMILDDKCAACGICAIECPTNAISEHDDAYVIDPDRCVECVGYYDSPQCVLVCTAKAIVPDLEHRESKEELLLKKAKLSE